MQNRDSPSGRRRTRRVLHAQKRADCALHLPRLPKEIGGKGVQNSRVNSMSQKAQTGNFDGQIAVAPFAIPLDFSNVIFYRGIYLKPSSRHAEEKKATSDNYPRKWLPFEPNRFRPTTTRRVRLKLRSTLGKANR